MIELKKVLERGDENFFFRKTYPLMVILIEKKSPREGTKTFPKQRTLGILHLY